MTSAMQKTWRQSDGPITKAARASGHEHGKTRARKLQGLILSLNGLSVVREIFWKTLVYGNPSLIQVEAYFP